SGMFPVDSSFDAFGAVVGDFNGDGKLDVAMSLLPPLGEYGGVGIVLGNGDGTFQAAMEFPAGYHPIDIVAADFNGDGKMDVAVADSGIAHSGKGSVAVLFGNGDGSFQSPSLYPAGSSPFSLAAGDVNGDGIPDLAVADSAGFTVAILLGQSNGR